ncbi:MAG: LamG domain-containing protein [Fibrobacter sp.]|nr:LamG domain-containing protein [Fibrobacter sp.]
MKNKKGFAMKKKTLSLVFLSFLFAACGDDSSFADNAVKEVSEEEQCADIYGYDLNEVSWEPFHDETSFMKKDILNKAMSVMYSYSRNMEARSIEYDENADNYKILVMDLANSPSAHNHFVSADIQGCMYRFYEDEELYSFLKEQPVFKINPCLCSEQEGKFYYLNVKNDSEKPRSSSLSDKRSSSSARSSSSSKEKYSSSVASSSSIELSSSSAESSSSLEKIVCAEQKPVQIDSPFVVAYEFNDPNDLGADYFGKNNAKVVQGKVNGDCDNVILDGKSGFVIPLSETFKSNGFVVEARVYPEKFNTMQNILVSEPPGNTFSGWQLRLDNGEVMFHLRDDSKNSSQWKVFRAGKVALNEWTVIRAEKHSSGKIIIQVNGETVVEDVYIGNVVNDTYDLGLGYDAMNQTRMAERYFVGKMDYVRFGVLEDETPEEVPEKMQARLIEDETTGRVKVAALDETLVCPAIEADPSITDFAVAYEFNDINDLGFDAGGKNHANLGVGAPDGDCSALVLDGSSGLLIPLTDDFKSKGVDVSVRFMLTDVNERSTIFGSSPKTGDGDGWRISVSNGEVNFEAMDDGINNAWEPIKLESVAENQWIEVRVKIFPAKSELDGVVFYSLNVRIDGGLRMAAEFKGDLSHLTSDLAIGYNPLNGGSEFAKGKIDFVRFNAPSEEGL